MVTHYKKVKKRLMPKYFFSVNKILLLSNKKKKLWPGICVKYFLSSPQKNPSPEKSETKEVFTIQFLNDEMDQNTKFAIFFSDKIFFEGTRENIFHIFQAYGLCQIHLVLLQASLLAANIIPFFCNLAKIRSIRLMSHM